MNYHEFRCIAGSF